jgi:hypothetical protein
MSPWIRMYLEKRESTRDSAVFINRRVQRINVVMTSIFKNNGSGEEKTLIILYN